MKQKMARTLTALAVTGAVVFTGAAKGCTSDGPGSPATSKPQTQASDCAWNIYATDCGSTPSPKADGAPTAKASATHGTNPVEGSRVWGGDAFGDCDVYLWPAGSGLSVVPHYYPASSGYPPPYAAVVADVTTGCVGYQPSEFTIHIHLQRYYSLTMPGHTPQPESWHDVTRPVVDGRKPNVVPLDPATGLMYYSLMTRYTLPDSYLPALSTPCNGAFTSTYRVQLDIVGTSYSGEPFVGGGTGATFTVTPAMCANASYSFKY